MPGSPSIHFVEALTRKGFEFFTGVPCSLLAGLISSLEKTPGISYIPSIREDSAVGLCAGAFMAGKLPVLLMQNSGLGYCLNAFTSLNLIYKIPVLVIMSWRGFQGKDAPEHIIMGEINEDLLKTAGMEYALISRGNQDAVLDQACKKIKEENIPFTLLVQKGLFDERH
ncbi:MAG: thiamine pyrophosphate-binding protein [Nitrospinota bacterium]|nr:thiamine pyrophosphate-binding protein [Nitrospinota bacterium]